MHFSVQVDTWRISIFGAINAVFLIAAAFFLIARLTSFYRRSFAAQDAPLQQLLLSATSPEPNAFNDTVFHSPRRNRATSSETKNRNDRRTRSTGGKNTTAAKNKKKKSSVPNFLLGGSWEGLQRNKKIDVILILPEYYVYTLITCMVFLVQAIAWVIPAGDLLGSLSSSLVFMTCLWNDTLLLLHLIRRPGASALATGILALIPTVAVTLFVQAWLPGDTGRCPFCNVRVPKPGIEYAWLICGMIALWISICSYKSWSLLPCYDMCGKQKSNKSPLLRHTTSPVLGPQSSGSRGFGANSNSTPPRIETRPRIDSYAYGGTQFLRPRKATTVLAMMMASVYLLSSASVFVLHYVGDSIDSGYCVLLISDLAYTLCYAPVLLRTVLVDSKECREYLVSTVLRRTLRIANDSPIKFGQNTNSNNGFGTNGTLNEGKMDAMNSPRLKDWTEAKREREHHREEASIESHKTQDIIFRLLTDPVLNLMNPQDLRFDAQIGVGGFGDVFLGSWRQLPVAIKRLHGIDLKASEALESLASEASMLASFRHPNTVLFIGMVLTREYCALVTEYMEGGSVRELLDNNGQDLDWKIRSMILRDAARGMVYLHGATPEPVIHRDLKSANFLIDHRTDPRVCKVCDFGLSTYKEKFGKERSRVGTPLFAAPEVLRNDEYSESADVYSFGVCCWEIATTDRPFANMNTVKALHDVAYKGLRPELTDKEKKTCPEWIDFLISRCFVNISEERPTMGDILSFIEEEMRKTNRKLEQSNSTLKSTNIIKTRPKKSNNSIGDIDNEKKELNVPELKLEEQSHEERLIEARKRLTMGKERRSLSRQQDRLKYASSTV